MPVQPPDFFVDCEKTAILVDGVGTHSLTRSLGWSIDYDRLRTYFQRSTALLKAYYITPMDANDEDSLSKLIDWLSFNHWQCCLVEYFSDNAIRDERTRKPSIDVEFTIKALQIAQRVDHIVLFTGASRYIPLVQALNSIGKKVTICSSIMTEPKTISYDLRKVADHFMDMADYRSDFERRPNPAERSVTRDPLHGIRPAEVVGSRQRTA